MPGEPAENSRRKRPPRDARRWSGLYGAAKSFDHGAGGGPGVGEDRVGGLLDVLPGVAGGGGQALERARGLLPLGLHDGQLRAGLLAEVTNPRPGVGFDPLLGLAEAAMNLGHRSRELADALLDLGVSDLRLAGERGLPCAGCHPSRLLLRRPRGQSVVPGSADRERTEPSLDREVARCEHRASIEWILGLPWPRRHAAPRPVHPARLARLRGPLPPPLGALRDHGQNPRGVTRGGYRSRVRARRSRTARRSRSPTTAPRTGCASFSADATSEREGASLSPARPQRAQRSPLRDLSSLSRAEVQGLVTGKRETQPFPGPVGDGLHRCLVIRQAAARYFLPFPGIDGVWR